MEYVDFDLDLDMDTRFPNVDLTKYLPFRARSKMRKLTAEQLGDCAGPNATPTSRDQHASNMHFDDPLLATQYLMAMTMTRGGSNAVPGTLFDASLHSINDNYRSMAPSPASSPLFVPGENMPPLPEFEALPPTYHTESPEHQHMSVAFQDIWPSPERTPRTPSLETTSDEHEHESPANTQNTLAKRKRVKAKISPTPIIQRKSDTRGRAAPKLSELAALDGLAGPRKEICDYCSTCFNRGEHKTRHMASVHGVGTKYHFCPVIGCHYKANRADNLRQHTLTHDSNDLPDNNGLPVSKRRKQQHHCPAEWCHYKTTKKGNLNKHMESCCNSEDSLDYELLRPTKRARSGSSTEASSSKSSAL